QRVLDQLDLLASLEMPYLDSGPKVAADAGRPAIDVLAELARYTDARTTYPDAAYVKSLVLGCAAGDQAPRWAVAGVRAAHPTTLDAHAAALKLGTNIGITAVVEDLSAEGD